MQTHGALALAALALLACSPSEREEGTVPDAGSGAAPDARGGDGFVDASPAVPGDEDGDAGTEECGMLTAIFRDFQRVHPDFESGLGDDRGLVQAELGTDGKPVYAPLGATPTVSGTSSFDQWYRDVPGVNLSFEQPLVFTETSPGLFVFDDGEFFPLDGLGWPGEEMLGHNYHFTTEIHGSFHYLGGEQFTFRGDDDVFVFVNGRLALDLGGVHTEQEQTIDFDAQAASLGLTLGQVFTLDVFHAERHTSGSNFRIETSIDCLIIP